MSGYDAIPLELRERPQWVVWRLEERDGKQTKVPYRATSPDRYASASDPATWASFEIAVQTCSAADGIGYVFSPEDPYVGIDLDELNADAGAIMLALDSYTEQSVSGQGAHVIVRASLNGHPRNRKGPLEVYEDGRYFVMTGRHLPGTPTTIEERQAELEEVLAEFLPAPEPQVSTAGGTSAPVDLDDQELIERARHANDDGDFDRLWRGDASEYADNDSVADFHFCKALAFWTGRDPDRIDRLFRASGLMRQKWNRNDYRERTIQAAIAATTKTYEPVRPRRDGRGTDAPSSPAGGGESGRPSPVPPKEGMGGTDGPSSPTAVKVQEPLQAEEAAAFAAIDEASAKPLLGDDENTILAAGGFAAWYGTGGAGKTTLGLDRACHLCAGRDWLGLPVPNPVRVLWIENEGPRGKFRKKLRAKLETWDGPSLEGRLHVLSSPWARFTFANEQMRAELVALVRTLEIEVVIAGPVSRLGAKGGGTPEEIQAFVDLLEQVRAELDRPLAYELIHHENKQGDVSGAWEGVTDTLAHVRARGNGHTAIVWDKARWAPDIHGKTWKLDWRDGEQFELDDTPETTDEEIAEKLLALVREAPGHAWGKYDELLTGKGTRKRAIRDELIEDGKLVNAGTPKAMRLYLPEQVDETLLDVEEAA
jgi:putative DNA primase/helicase